MATDPMQVLQTDLIPEPRQWSKTESAFRIGDVVGIALPDSADGDDCFAATDVATELRTRFGMQVDVGASGAIHLQRKLGSDLHPEGYELEVNSNGVTIRGYDAAGLVLGHTDIAAGHSTRTPRPDPRAGRFQG
ncbi:MAG: hypothetical protein O2782_02845 [bacterium]|nr:hypothetical protein [bacterium]